MKASVQVKDIRHQADEHLTLIIKCQNRPDITIDIANAHGRRVMITRINGMSMNSLLVDIHELSAYHNSDKVVRWCPFCGLKLNLTSARAHTCEDSTVGGERKVNVRTNEDH